MSKSFATKPACRPDAASDDALRGRGRYPFRSRRKTNREEEADQRYASQERAKRRRQQKKKKDEEILIYEGDFVAILAHEEERKDWEPFWLGCSCTEVRRGHDPSQLNIPVMMLHEPNHKPGVLNLMVYEQLNYICLDMIFAVGVRLTKLEIRLDDYFALPKREEARLLQMLKELEEEDDLGRNKGTTSSGGTRLWKGNEMRLQRGKSGEEEEEEEEKHARQEDAQLRLMMLKIVQKQGQRVEESDEENEFVIDKILDERVNKGEKEYLVKWKNVPTSTWEPEAELNSTVQFVRYKQEKGRRKREQEALKSNKKRTASADLDHGPNNITTTTTNNNNKNKKSKVEIIIVDSSDEEKKNMEELKEEDVESAESEIQWNYTDFDARDSINSVDIDIDLDLDASTSATCSGARSCTGTSTFDETSASASTSPTISTSASAGNKTITNTSCTDTMPNVTSTSPESDGRTDSIASSPAEGTAAFTISAEKKPPNYKAKTICALVALGGRGTIPDIYQYFMSHFTQEFSERHEKSVKRGIQSACAKVCQQIGRSGHVVNWKLDSGTAPLLSSVTFLVICSCVSYVYLLAISRDLEKLPKL